MKNTMKDRYCVLANEQLVLFRDNTCIKEMFKLRITPQMEIVGLGFTPSGFPVQIQEQNKLLLEIFMKTDEERQSIVKVLEACSKM